MIFFLVKEFWKRERQTKWGEIERERGEQKEEKVREIPECHSLLDLNLKLFS
jgi:hypothetical protein